MRRRVSPPLGLLATLAMVLSSAPAHASDERHRPGVGSAGPISAAIAANSGDVGVSAVQPQLQADPLSNGIGIGAAIGAGTGLALMAWAYAQCNDTCDAPEPLPMYLQAGGFGAAIGGVVGWLVDAHRKNTSQRVAVGAIAGPRRSEVRVSVRW